MPLWGLSLDRDMALSFGSRYVFEIDGEFPAVPAWMFSGIKSEERELITGGRYDVTHLDEVDGGVTVGLRFVEAIRL